MKPLTLQKIFHFRKSTPEKEEGEKKKKKIWGGKPQEGV